ncbi:MAG: Ycf66 family protein [Microcoleaceae cyanobacterium MO_207.B10]|nr:Ycf66 family protein [Microcoleaceae cyanobacterium MO_207.B10]
MLLCGFILLFQGWRLDPILSLAMFLLISTSIFLGLKDIFK